MTEKVILEGKPKLRLENLLRMIKKETGGNVEEFARIHNLNPTQIRGFKNRNRAMREEAASNLEKKLGLPDGYLALPPIEGRQVTKDLEAAIERASYLTDTYKKFLINSIQEIADSDGKEDP